MERCLCAAAEAEIGHSTCRSNKHCFIPYYNSKKKGLADERTKQCVAPWWQSQTHSLAICDTWRSWWIEPNDCFLTVLHQQYCTYTQIWQALWRTHLLVRSSREGVHRSQRLEQKCVALMNETHKTSILTQTAPHTLYIKQQNVYASASCLCFRCIRFYVQCCVYTSVHVYVLAFECVNKCPCMTALERGCWR